MLSVYEYKKITKLQARIDQIKEKILELGEIRPGSISKQFNVCGSPKCRCKDPKNPKKHGPYFQLSYTRKGKSKTEFIREHMIDDIKKQLNDYQIFRKLSEEWIDASIEIAKLRRYDMTSNKRG